MRTARAKRKLMTSRFVAGLKGREREARLMIVSSEETQLAGRKSKKKQLCFCGFLFLKVCQSGVYLKDGGRVIGALITATGEP
jgi:hypothetical protein